MSHNMEQFKDLRKDRTALGVLCFLITTTIFTFVDILCVGAYIGLILCLLYFTFLKDCLEISTFAIGKCVARLNWLYRIFKISELLYITTEADECKSNTIVGSVPDSFGVLSDSCIVQNSPDAIAQSSSNSKTFGQSIFSSSQSGNSFPIGETRSSDLFLSSKSGSGEPTPRKLSSLSSHIISSTENFNFDETNFEDVDLHEENIERDLVTPEEVSNFKRSSLRWNIGKITFFDSFRKNKLTPTKGVKKQLGNVAAKAIAVQPKRADDKVKLMSSGSKDTPEQIGCCTTLPHLFKTKYQSSIASYGKF